LIFFTVVVRKWKSDCKAISLASDNFFLL
jgi:hypothetical protein